MLNKPPLEELLPKAENRYVLALLAAKRARQLVDGAQPLVDTKEPKAVTIACEELITDKVLGIKGKVEPVILLRPEIEAARLHAKEEEEAKRMEELQQEEEKRAAFLLKQQILAQNEQEFASAQDNLIGQRFVEFLHGHENASLEGNGETFLTHQEPTDEVITNDAENNGTEDDVLVIEENSNETALTNEQED